MLESKYIIYPLLLCLTGCVPEFSAQPPTSDKEPLVVTSDIIASAEVVFSLNKGVPLSEELSKNYRGTGTRIIVTGSDDYRSNPGKATGEDKYQISIGELQNNVSCGVEIEYNREIYISSPPEPMETPKIDSISWIQSVKEQPPTIRISTHGDPKKTQYYMWNYKEGWEIRTNYMATCYFDPKTNRIYGDSSYPTFYCWKKESSKDILISSIQSLKENRIINNELFKASVRGDKFTVLYSILIQQRALGKAGYKYYLNVQQQDKDMGGIFIPQPSEVQGNLSYTTQSERRAIGYVGVYKNIVERRIYIRPNNMGHPPRCTDCEGLANDDLNEVGYNTYLTKYLADYRPVGTGVYIGNWTLQGCIECEYNRGDKNKPSSWPNNHR